jgi:hypothetical protein
MIPLTEGVDGVETMTSEFRRDFRNEEGREEDDGSEVKFLPGRITTPS